jgi:hypothetical protein
MLWKLTEVDGGGIDGQTGARGGYANPHGLGGEAEAVMAPTGRWS